MTRKDFQPGPAAEVAALPDGERWTLVFVRELRHPRDKVWSALTDPAQLRAWSPFDVDRDLGRTGDVVLSMAGAGREAEDFGATVRRAERPALLEYTWGEDLLRWELEATASGTRLTLRHTTDRAWLARASAGWHIVIDVMARLLEGKPVGRIVGEEAKHYGWQQLDETYARMLGVPSTGWPDGHPAPG